MLRDYAYESASNRVQHILVSHVVGEPTGVFGARIHNHEFEIKASAPVSRRSMRGERRGFVLDQGFLGHGCCGGRSLVPLDRLRLACHRASEQLVHARDRNDLESALDAIHDFGLPSSMTIGLRMLRRTL